MVTSNRGGDVSVDYLVDKEYEQDRKIAFMAY